MARKQAPERRPLLSLKDAAAYLGCTDRQLKRRIYEGSFAAPVVKWGGKRWFEPEELDKYKATLPRYLPSQDLEY